VRQVRVEIEWLVASGGVLVFAFPRAYAAAFSGFYLPLMLVLWLLIVRGLAIEFRGQWHNPLWRQFLDAAFAFSSALLAFVLGASLGNVVRGVPLGDDGSFAAPLFSSDGRTGALDAYTMTVGLLATATLALHGAHWLMHKTEGPVQARSRVLAKRLWPVVAALLTVVTIWTGRVAPMLFRSLLGRWPVPANLVVRELRGSMAGGRLARRAEREAAREAAEAARAGKVATAPKWMS